jgi:hypothetical protein
MRKLVTAGLAAFALAIPVAATAGNSGDGSEYHPQGSACGQYHGAFGFFGKNNNLGVKSDPADPGADGQATGAANSAKGCQNNYPTAPAP